MKFWKRIAGWFRRPKRTWLPVGHRHDRWPKMPDQLDSIDTSKRIQSEWNR